MIAAAVIIALLAGAVVLVVIRAARAGRRVMDAASRAAMPIEQRRQPPAAAPPISAHAAAPRTRPLVVPNIGRVAVPPPPVHPHPVGRLADWIGPAEASVSADDEDDRPAPISTHAPEAVAPPAPFDWSQWEEEVPVVPATDAAADALSGADLVAAFRALGPQRRRRRPPPRRPRVMDPSVDARQMLLPLPVAAP